MPPSPTQDLGFTGQSHAEQFLIANGYTILDRNFQAGHFGEIDLIAQDGDTLVFVEVRTRTTTSGSTPAESVSDIKLDRIILAAELYLVRHGLDPFWRIDVIALYLNVQGQPVHTELYRNVTLG